MSSLTLDPATAAALLAAKDGVELLGPDGAPLGTYFPKALVGTATESVRQRRYLVERMMAEFPPEVLDRIEAEGAPYTMDDVFKLLERP